MHLIWENCMDNLILLWTGNFKGLDEGKEQYHLDSSIWNAITAATCSKRGHNTICFQCTSSKFHDAEVSLLSGDLVVLGPVPGTWAFTGKCFTGANTTTILLTLLKLIHICLQFKSFITMRLIFIRLALSNGSRSMMRSILISSSLPRLSF